MSDNEGLLELSQKLLAGTKRMVAVGIEVSTVTSDLDAPRMAKALETFENALLDTAFTVGKLRAFLAALPAPPKAS